MAESRIQLADGDSVRSRALLPGALLATAALLAACSTDGPPPLAAGGFAAGGLCAPLALGHPVTDGFYILDNTSTSAVTVTSVKLASSSHGLAMTTPWLIPLSKSPRGGSGYAGEQVYPPTSWPTWPQRQRIPGAVIKPHQELNLVLGLTRTGPQGHTPGPVITYTAGGNTYTLQEHSGFVIVAPHTRCPPNG
jgi:hypothetical protein